MTRAEKRRFVRSLVRSVEASILRRVQLMPASWDGHELRLLLARAFAFECGDLLPLLPRDLPRSRRRMARGRRHDFDGVDLGGRL